MAPGLYGRLAPFYDRIYHFKDYEGEVAELTRRARAIVGPGRRRLLDVACGTGRHLEYFRRGFSVQGVDASAPMLREAGRRLGRAVPLARDDMRRFRADPPVEVLVCLFSAIGYLPTSRDRRAAFRCFFDSLVPGGVAMIEGWLTPEAFRPGSLHLQTYSGPEVKIARLSRASRHGSFSHIEMEYLLLESGRRPAWRVRELHRQPLVPPAQMLRELAETGFRPRVVFSGRWAQRGLYVARRPRGTRLGAPAHSTLR